MEDRNRFASPQHLPVEPEADRADDDLDQPFAQAAQLTAARGRVRGIDEKLKREAAPPPGHQPAGNLRRRPITLA
jgi:hypothetical protein